MMIIRRIFAVIFAVLCFSSGLVVQAEANSSESACLHAVADEDCCDPQFILPGMCHHIVYMSWKELHSGGSNGVRVTLRQEVEKGAFSTCDGIAWFVIEYQPLRDGEISGEITSRSGIIGSVDVVEDVYFPPAISRCKFKWSLYALETGNKVGKLMDESVWYTIYF